MQTHTEQMLLGQDLTRKFVQTLCLEARVVDNEACHLAGRPRGHMTNS